ncbi:MAG: alpha-galactosidase [Actinobacteria bacterium]|nr:alpha-galactosidase [Actinomycetota bacterium]
MIADFSLAGLTLSVADEPLMLAAGRPGVIARFGNERIEWNPTALEATGPDSATAQHPNGLRIEWRWSELSDVELAGAIEVTARLVNDGSVPVTLERFTLFESGGVTIGDNPRRWRTYRNSHQSWAGTYTLGTDERDADLPTEIGRRSGTDAKHRAPTAPGHVRSDWISATVEPISGHGVAAAFTTMADAYGFIELRPHAGRAATWSAWVDLDDISLSPDAATPWFKVVIAADQAGGAAADALLRSTAELAGDAMEARGVDAAHPAGWCSWYYYFTKVTEADVRANLAVLAEDGRGGEVFGCDYVMIDDGHQAGIGDWLTTSDKFPSGMASLAADIRAAGFDAGIWWAPFIVGARSRVARSHPEWLVRNAKGRPVHALLNPNWAREMPIYALDTTHPGALEHLARVADTIGNEWGYRIQKLDFLFTASLPGVRHDRSATRAQSLRRGLEAIRDGAGEDSFLLGCGSPLGPAVGVVDAMRIGADVTPSWNSAIAKYLGRGRHGLATVNALRNTINRSVLDRAWFLNDPDCLMVRADNTSLTEAEVRTMCTVFGLTDGMIVLSDDLTAVRADRRSLVRRTLGLTGGDHYVADLFETADPSIIVSRHADHVDVGVVNLTDEPRPARVEIDRLGIAEFARTDGPAEATEYWSGRTLGVHGGIVDAGTLAPHESVVLRFTR